MTIKKYFKPKNYLWKIRSLMKPKKISYSQCGEDLIIRYLLATLGMSEPSYIDIGVNDPIRINNTFLFYENGSRGVCIEPDPELFKKIQKKRKRDICLNIGVSDRDGTGDYYVMTSKALSTFNKKEAEKYVLEKNYGTQTIEKIIPVPITSINNILQKYSKYGDILSIDTEGYDARIIMSIDFIAHRPKVICVESARCEAGGKIKKNVTIINYILDKGYILYADTYVNSIFVDKKIWIF